MPNSSRGLGSTYEGLKQVLRQHGGQEIAGLGSTYEGLKQKENRTRNTWHARLGSTYEGLKPSKQRYVLLRQVWFGLCLARPK